MPALYLMPSSRQKRWSGLQEPEDCEGHRRLVPRERASSAQVGLSVVTETVRLGSSCDPSAARPAKKSAADHAEAQASMAGNRPQSVPQAVRRDTIPPL